MSANPKRPIRNAKDPAVVRAEKLWKRLRHDLLSSQKAIIEIIRARAWEPLGYETFAKAWIDQMRDVSIKVELLPHVIYELLGDESLTEEEIAEMVKGVGLDGVDNLKRQKEAGVPPDLATARKPRKTRKDGGSTVFLHPGPERKARWEVVAAERDMTLSEFIIAVVDAAC